MGRRRAVEHNYVIIDGGDSGEIKCSMLMILDFSSSIHVSLFQISDILLHFQMLATKRRATLKSTPHFALFDPL